MKTFLVFALGLALAVGATGCEKAVAPVTFASPEHQVLYELMVERCNAINARDATRLSKVYVKDSPDLNWLIKDGLPDFSRWGITQEVTQMRKLTIVGVDAAGTFDLQLRGQLARTRSPIAKVDVLYVKEGGQWKIESVAEQQR